MMTDVVGYVAGGLKECYKYLDERLKELWKTSFICGSITLLITIGLGAFAYSKYVQRQIEQDREKM